MGRNRGGAHIILLDKPLGVLTNRLEIDGKPRGKRRPVIGLEHQILIDLIHKHQAVLVTVLRDMCGACLSDRARPLIGHLMPV